MDNKWDAIQISVIEYLKRHGILVERRELVARAADPDFKFSPEQVEEFKHSPEQLQAVWAACSEFRIRNMVPAHMLEISRRITPSRNPRNQQPGETYADYTLRHLREAGVPITRANYMRYYYGDPNYEPDPEEELDIPDQFRRLIGPRPQ